MAQDLYVRTPHPTPRLLITATLIASAVPLARCQTTPVPPSSTPPAYEVATIKPPDPNGLAMPLRIYIQEAFGLPLNASGLVFGPDWINTTKYAIHGKPPDTIRDAMKSMTPAERGKEEDLMMQALLADRFNLKAHFETRVMPLYELRLAKCGPKLKENPDTSKGAIAVGASGIRGTAVPMHVFAEMLESVADIGGRVVLEKTGLTGTYDFNFRWAPLQPNASSSGSSGPASTDAQASLFTAIEEQLGLKLVPTKGPGQVLIIDHIERPSEN